MPSAIKLLTESTGFKLNQKIITNKLSRRVCVIIILMNPFSSLWLRERVLDPNKRESICFSKGDGRFNRS